MIEVKTWSCLLRQVNSWSKAWAVEHARSAAFHLKGEWRDTVPRRNHNTEDNVTQYVVWSRPFLSILDVLPTRLTGLQSPETPWCLGVLAESLGLLSGESWTS